MIRLLALSLFVAGNALAQTPAPAPETKSFFEMRPSAPASRNGRDVWVFDSSPKPAHFLVILGPREFGEAQKLERSLDRALEKFIAAEVKRREACDAGYRIRPGNRATGRDDSYSFVVDCAWR